MFGICWGCRVALILMGSIDSRICCQGVNVAITKSQIICAFYDVSQWQVVLWETVDISEKVLVPFLLENLKCQSCQRVLPFHILSVVIQHIFHPSQAVACWRGSLSEASSYEGWGLRRVVSGHFCSWYFPNAEEEKGQTAGNCTKVGLLGRDSFWNEPLADCFCAIVFAGFAKILDC